MSGTAHTFSPPGNLSDISAKNLHKWSAEISGIMTECANVARVSQFYNPAKRSTSGEPTDVPILWNAFPNTIKRQGHTDNDRWRLADETRNVQDEYCEWSVKKNDQGKITKVVFTCEGPEYWQFLAKHQPDTLLQLYKNLNPGFPIKREDLFDQDGNYDQKNKWNNSTTTGCIAHLIQEANTLGAEIKLAADATILRHDKNGKPVSDQDQLINCSLYGVATRNSDPTIGSGVNQFARDGNLITLPNPVGLYMDGFDGSDFVAPDGDDVSTFFTPVRGDPDHIVRAVFGVPEGKNYVVGDIRDSSRNLITYGSQLADYITMKLYGRAVEPGQHTGQMYPCKRKSDGAEVDENGNPIESQGLKAAAVDAVAAVFSAAPLSTGAPKIFQMKSRV